MPRFEARLLTVTVALLGAGAGGALAQVQVVQVSGQVYQKPTPPPNPKDKGNPQKDPYYQMNPAPAAGLYLLMPGGATGGPRTAINFNLNGAVAYVEQATPVPAEAVLRYIRPGSANAGILGIPGGSVPVQGSMVAVEFTPRPIDLSDTEQPKNQSGSGGAGGQSPLNQLMQGLQQLLKGQQGQDQQSQSQQAQQAQQAYQGQPTGYTSSGLGRSGSTSEVARPGNGTLYDTNGNPINGESTTAGATPLSTRDIEGGTGGAPTSGLEGQPPAANAEASAEGPTSGQSGLGGTPGEGRPGEEQTDEEKKKKKQAKEEESSDGKAKRQLDTLRGRVMLVQRVVQEQARDPAQGWGQEWTASAQPAAPAPPRRETFAQHVTRLEGLLAAWRLHETGAATGAAPRSPAGPIDTNRFDVWVIAGDSWREGQLPSRYRLSIGDELAGSLELTHGSWVVLQGKPEELPEPLVAALQGVQGEAHGFRLSRVVLSAPEPPAFNTGAGLGAPVEVPAAADPIIDGMSPELQKELLGE